jgi:hypothetical protein
LCFNGSALLSADKAPPVLREMLLLSYRFEKGFLLRDGTLQRKVILKAGGSTEIGNALSTR